MSLAGGDVVDGVRLALRLHEDGFFHENAGDVRYKGVQADILNFRHLLETLDDALRDAQRRYVRSERAVRVHAYEPLSEEFENERRRFVGNFVETLKACDALRQENNHSQLRYNNAGDDREHAWRQDRCVDDIRARLQCHSEKIRFVLDRLSITLLTDEDAYVDNFHAVSGHRPNNILPELDRLRSTLFRHLAGHGVVPTSSAEDAHQVSDRVAQKCQRYLFLDAPPGIQSGVPLILGFDALLSHLRRSTGSSGQSPETYLSFLKTWWLLACLIAGRDYDAASPGFYFKRAINLVSQAVTTRAQVPISYSESTLLNLADVNFLIWPPSDPPAIQQNQPDPLMMRANEEKVVSIGLGPEGRAGGDSVTVFKSSEERFRVILETTLPSRPNEKILIPQPVYICEDSLIPRYALPTIINPVFEMAIFSRNEETLYTFSSFQDLCRFQTALTGYDVSYDQPGIRCQFSDNVSFLDCNGRIQLWQEPIVPGNPTKPERAQGDSFLPVTDDTLSGHGSLAGSIVTANTIHSTTGGWEAEKIKLPVLTIFTEVSDRKNKRFAIISIELEPGVYIDPKECKCCRDYDTCSKLVLTKGRKADFVVRALFSDKNSVGQSDFDLLPFRIPRHPSFQKLMTRRTEYLVLKFGSLLEKRRFDEELRLRFRVRDKQMQNQSDFARRIRSLQTQLPHRQPSFSPGRAPVPMGPPYNHSFTPLPSVHSLPPRLDMPYSNPSLGYNVSATSFNNGSEGKTEAGFTAMSTSSRSNSIATVTDPRVPELEATEISHPRTASQASPSNAPPPLHASDPSISSAPRREGGERESSSIERDIKARVASIRSSEAPEAYVQRVPSTRSSGAPELYIPNPAFVGCTPWEGKDPDTTSRAASVATVRPKFQSEVTTALPKVGGRRKGFLQTFKF
ncbi:hypothetical protein LTR36_005945 [Oleoguttula mirabilis]|uniref:Uncharacterized protein n=1 Tax=Oleoguttula mirabilis TaxID=1507867 RepID=A0AAV9JCR3_9PEZI|nr:hypothetical protein LTR36_005945 [Oleoguttula mirabilis]